MVKRLEALELGRRVHAGLQLMRIALSGDIFSGDHTHQRMIPAFGMRHRRDTLARLAGNRSERCTDRCGRHRAILSY
jgi:hypothetical protein